MKKICSLVLLAFLVFVPVQSALGLTISVAPAAKIPGGSITPTCIRTGGSQVCMPVRIPSSNIAIPSASSRVVVIKVNAQPVTASRPTSAASRVNTPTSAPVPVPTPTAVESNSTAMQQEMLGYINAERAKANAPALVLDAKLSDGAYLKSKDMALNAYFDHTSPTYGSPFDMMKNLGIVYRTAGENIAKHTSVLGAHNAFMNSPGHKANILNSSFNKAGLGFYSYGSYLYITEWFTN